MIYFIMGVSGCGKSTIGVLVAEKLKITFFDGDDYHPKANIEKMKSGNPLNDDDRAVWLQNLNTLAVEHKNKGAVIACSALKESYRTILKKDIADNSVFIYLEGSFQQITERLQKRSGHFMPPQLLKSQFDTLEPPEDCIKVSITQNPADIVKEVIKKIN